MNATTPVERVVSILVEAKYKRISTPLAVAGMSFDFPAVLIGAVRSPDLIVVVDAAMEGEERIRQKVEGLARALDVMNSRRPLTLIITGPRPRGPTLDSLSRVCRVLSAGDASDAPALKDAVSVLLPLAIPDPEEELEEGLAPSSDQQDAVVDALLAEAPGGAEAVKARLFELIDEPFDATEGEP